MYLEMYRDGQTEYSYDRYIVTVLMLTAAGACFGVVLLNFWGNLMDYQATRFALAIYVWSIVAAVLMMSESSALKRHRKKCLVICSVVAVCSSVPSSAQHKVTLKMTPSIVTEWYLDFARERGREDIFCRSGLSLAVNDFACSLTKAVNKNPNLLFQMRAHGIYKRIFALQQ